MAVAAKGLRSPRWAFFKRMTLTAVRADGTRYSYLRRLRIISTPWFSVMLHHIDAPDPDLDPHDHPWTFWSLVLHGEYHEMVWEAEGSNLLSLHQRKLGSVHRMLAEGMAHKITSVAPDTVTLVITGRRRESWGFWCQYGIVDWRDHERVWV